MSDRTYTGRSRFIVGGILALVGILAALAITLIAQERLKTTLASDGQDTSALNLGLIGSGFGNASPTGTGPVADIATGLVTRAFSFSPGKFDHEVAAAKRLMTIAMQQHYEQQLAAQRTRVLVTRDRLQVTTSVVHFENRPTQYAFVGVVSLSQTSGEFLMYVQRTATTAGSTQAQVTPFMLDVTVARIGNTWMLSDVRTI